MQMNGITCTKYITQHHFHLDYRSFNWQGRRKWQHLHIYTQALRITDSVRGSDSLALRCTCHAQLKLCCGGCVYRRGRVWLGRNVHFCSEVWPCTEFTIIKSITNQSLSKTSTQAIHRPNAVLITNLSFSSGFYCGTTKTECTLFLTISLL